MIQGLMLKKMQKLANDITTKVVASYKRMKSSHSDLNEVDIYFLCLCDVGQLDKSKIPAELERNIKKKFCTSIEGVCYVLGLEFGFLKGCMAMRGAQFTAMVDRFLSAKGCKATSQEIKINLYKELDLYDTYISSPRLFN